jgi:hypothetical protein
MVWNRSEDAMSPDSSSSLLAAAARLFWMMIGPAILFILGCGLFSDTAGWANGIDVEYRNGAPLTAQGTAAKPADLQRHTLLVTILGLGVWVIANVLTNVRRD